MNVIGVLFPNRDSKNKVKYNSNFYKDPHLDLFLFIGGTKDKGREKLAEFIFEEIQLFIKKNQNTLNLYNSDPTPLGRLEIEALLRKAVSHANKQLHAKLSEKKEHLSFGFTLNLVLFVKDYIFLSQVGDDSLFLLRNDQIQNLRPASLQKLTSLELGFRVDGSNIPDIGDSQGARLGQNSIIKVWVQPVPILPEDVIIFALGNSGLEDFKLKPTPQKASFSDKEQLQALYKGFTSGNKRKSKSTSSPEILILKLIERRKIHKIGEPSLEQQFSILKQVPIFKELSNDQEGLNRLHSLALTKKFSESHVLMREGQESSELYILLTGTANIFKKGTLVYKCPAGTIIGEIGVFNHEKRSFTAILSSDAHVMTIKGSELMSMIENQKSFGLRLYAGIVKELSNKLKQSLGEGSI